MSPSDIGTAQLTAPGAPIGTDIVDLRTRIAVDVKVAGHRRPEVVAVLHELGVMSGAFFLPIAPPSPSTLPH